MRYASPSSLATERGPQHQWYDGRAPLSGRPVGDWLTAEARWVWRLFPRLPTRRGLLGQVGTP